jgi:hypothetical protein
VRIISRLLNFYSMSKLYQYVSVFAFAILPNFIFSQAPNMGSTVNFVLFSSDGAVSNVGPSHLTGKVGTNNGSSIGFGNVNGGMHDGDAVSVAAATDLLIAYNELNNKIPTIFPASVLGNGQTLTPGVHQINEAATLNQTLFLDAQNDPDAVFIFLIEAAFSSNALSEVALLNQAQACNVFWLVKGLVDMEAGTTMCGSVIAYNAGINMGAGGSLEGRALAINGAITIDQVLGYTPVGCGSPVLYGPIAPVFGEVGCYGIFSANGSVINTGTTSVLGDVGSNVGSTDGYDSLLVTGNIHLIPDSSTSAAAMDLILVYEYLNAVAHDIKLLYPSQFGRNLVLTPHTYLLDAATLFTDTLYLNAQGQPDAIFVIKINGALETSVYSNVILINEAKAENVYWLVNGAIDIAEYSIFNGTMVAQGAISLMTGATINGNALTGVGAISSIAIESAAYIDEDNCNTSIGGDPWASMDEDVLNYAFNAFPNPFQQSFQVDIENLKNDAAVLILYNTLGVELFVTHLKNGSNTIDINGLISGLYFYRVIEDNKLIHSGKIVAQ